MSISDFFIIFANDFRRGRKSPPSFCINRHRDAYYSPRCQHRNSLRQNMIDRQALADFIESRLKDTDCFLTELNVSPANVITVEIDSMLPIDIERCVELTRDIEAAFDRDVEDYELEVGSAGLTSPFKVRRQYEKYIGQDVEALTADGRKLHGKLRSAGPDSFTITIERKVKPEGAKKPVIEPEDITLGYDQVKYTRYDLKF